ncbi:MAG: C-GCAxxG-C-C family protein [Deltaproteobacteria bacterium]|nr:C-GCAxxG-C-C family protein [Deltaproteobacteria bacterium]
MDELLRMLKVASQGFHCSQILILMGLDAQGKQNADLVRAMEGLAGGVGFCGDICGALTGGACLLALYAGRGLPDEGEDSRLNLMIAELAEWFSQEFATCYGGIHCREILDDDPRNQSARCPGIVTKTYDQVKTLLLNNGFDLSEGK